MPSQLPNSIAHELFAAEGRTGLTAALVLARQRLELLMTMKPAVVEQWFKNILDTDPRI